MAWGNLSLSQCYFLPVWVFVLLVWVFVLLVRAVLLKISRFAIQLPCFDFICESAPKKLLLKINKIDFGLQKS